MKSKDTEWQWILILHLTRSTKKWERVNYKCCICIGIRVGILPFSSWIWFYSMEKKLFFNSKTKKNSESMTFSICLKLGFKTMLLQSCAEVSKESHFLIGFVRGYFCCFWPPHSLQTLVTPPGI